MGEEEESAASSNLQAEDAPEEQPVQQELPVSPQQLTLADRIQALGSQHYITKEHSYEGTIWEKKKTIDRKFHLIGHAHKRNTRVRREMRSELETFLWELAGHVPKGEFNKSIKEVREFVVLLDQTDELEQVPLLYAKISQIFYEVRLGLKTPIEKSVFDLDVEQIFQGHLVRIEKAKEHQEAMTETEKMVQEIVKK